MYRYNLFSTSSQPLPFRANTDEKSEVTYTCSPISIVPSEDIDRTNVNSSRKKRKDQRRIIPHIPVSPPIIQSPNINWAVSLSQEPREDNSWVPFRCYGAFITICFVIFLISTVTSS